MSSSLGYWLLETNVRVSGSGAPYRGIDRLPTLPGPDEDQALGGRGADRLLRTRDRYWNADESGELRRDLRLAVELRREFEALGISVEVVRAEIAEIPDPLGIPADLDARFRSVLAARAVEPLVLHEGTLLGVDVTFPFPDFHSAIRQPVLSAHDRSVLDQLNEAGLFPDMDTARPVAESCNRLDTAWRPFCAVAVYLVENV